jgi:hypothetical protein
MNSIAKQTITCDFCKSVLNKETDDDALDNIEATLPDKDGNKHQFHMCGESCLLGFLQNRAKRKKTSKACFEINSSLKK